MLGNIIEVDESEALEVVDSASEEESEEDSGSEEELMVTEDEVSFDEFEFDDEE